MKCVRCCLITPHTIIDAYLTMSKRFIIQYHRCDICSAIQKKAVYA